MKENINYKYKVKQVTDEDIQDELSEVVWDDINEIDYLTLPVAATGDTVSLFMTRHELLETEKRIQRYFRELSTIIDQPGGSFEVLNLFQNLRPRYSEALDFIGFRPPELTNMDESLPCHGCPDEDDDPADWETNWEIEQAYSSCIDSDHNTVPGMKTLTRVSSKLVYSLEAFIRVMKDEL